MSIKPASLGRFGSNRGRPTAFQAWFYPIFRADAPLMSLIRLGLPNGHNVRRTAPICAFARQNERPDAILRGRARFEMGVAAHGIDHDPIAVQDVLALADHDISGQRNGLLLEIVDAEVAARILVLGGDGDAAPCLDS